jgi:hypothetical protein
MTLAVADPVTLVGWPTIDVRTVRLSRRPPSSHREE